MTATGTTALIEALSVLHGDSFEHAVVGHLSRVIDEGASARTAASSPMRPDSPHPAPSNAIKTALQ